MTRSVMSSIVCDPIRRRGEVERETGGIGGLTESRMAVAARSRSSLAARGFRRPRLLSRRQDRLWKYSGSKA